jgi:hypothetical protein
MFFINSAVIILLQAICVIHCIRKGNSGNWIWLIIFLPVAGAIAYILSEVFTSGRVEQVQAGVSTVLNPSGKIKKLEQQLKFSDTFNNRVQLADAYLANGHTGKAIALYENSLTGAFSENEYVLTQLNTAYFQMQRYDDVITITKKIYKLPQFPRSRAHLQYAMALEQTGNSEAAEKEFKIMKVRFACFEARYQFSMFLLRANREEEAGQLLKDIIEEATQLSPHEKRNHRKWINLAKEQLKSLSVQTV